MSIELLRILGEMLSKLNIHIKCELSLDAASRDERPDISRKEFELLQHKVQALYERKENGKLSPLDLDDLEVDLYSRGIQVLSRDSDQKVEVTDAHAQTSFFDKALQK